MPWHDIAIRIEGKPCLDIAYYFLQYWEYIIKDVDPDRFREFVIIGKNENKVIQDSEEIE
jgi:phosphatidylserine/phosphatidylglycerophosphate/cardiolipin synthase-like enzyme